MKMRRLAGKILSGLMLLCLCALVVFPAFMPASQVLADTYGTTGKSLPLLTDAEMLLDETEAETVQNRLEEVSDKYNMDVVIVTTGSLGNRTATEFADDFFDYNGYGRGADFDGILLLVSEWQREWAISTTGYGIYAFTDAGLDYMEENFVYLLSSGDYYLAFMEFADLCDEFLAQAQTGDPYDVGNMPKEPFSMFWVFAAVVVGLIVALIVTGSMKSEMRSVSPREVANDYVISGSLNVTDSREMYLYRRVTKVARPKDEDSGRGGSSTHTGSSGRSHGGSSGSF